MPNRERITEIGKKSDVLKKVHYHHGDLRAQLVEATRQLVEQKGPDSFSVSEACRAAGVSTAAPYRHFSDKQDMLIAVAIDGMIRMRGMMERALEGKSPGTFDSIAALGEVYIEFATTEPGVFRLSFGLTRQHKDREDMMTEGRQNFGIVLREVSLLQGKGGEIDDEVMQRAFSLWTMVHGTSFLLIDEKVSAMQLEIDIPTFVRNGTERLLSTT